MDYYHIWFNLKPGVRDVEFADAIFKYLGGLRDEGRIHDFRLRYDFSPVRTFQACASASYSLVIVPSRLSKARAVTVQAARSPTRLGTRLAASFSIPAKALASSS